MIKKEYKLHQYFESLALIIISEITPNSVKVIELKLVRSQ